MEIWRLAAGSAHSSWGGSAPQTLSRKNGGRRPPKYTKVGAKIGAKIGDKIGATNGAKNSWKIGSKISIWRKIRRGGASIIWSQYFRTRVKTLGRPQQKILGARSEIGGAYPSSRLMRLLNGKRQQSIMLVPPVAKINQKINIKTRMNHETRK